MKKGDATAVFPRRKDLYEHMAKCHVKEDLERREAKRKMRAKSGRSLHTLAEKVLDEDFGGVQRLERLVGIPKAVEMMLFTSHYSKLTRRCFPGPLLSHLPVVGIFAALPVQRAEGILEGECEERKILTEVQSDGKAVEITCGYRFEITAGYIPKNKVGGVLSAPAVWHLAEKPGINLGGIQVTVKARNVLKASIADFSGIMSALSGVTECQDVLAGPGGQQEDKTVLLSLGTLSMAFSKYSWMNNCSNEESLEVTLKGFLGMGKVIAALYGLVAPKQLGLKNVQSLSFLKVNPEDETGGMITVSNIGAITGNFDASFVTLPEITIIVTGQVEGVPHFADDEDVISASVITVATGAEYWDLDGATVARLCNDWKHFIDKPEFLMLIIEKADLEY